MPHPPLKLALLGPGLGITSGPKQTWWREKVEKDQLWNKLTPVPGTIHWVTTMKSWEEIPWLHMLDLCLHLCRSWNGRTGGLGTCSDDTSTAQNSCETFLCKSWKDLNPITVKLHLISYPKLSCSSSSHLPWVSNGFWLLPRIKKSFPKDRIVL